jgi:protein ImuB
MPRASPYRCSGRARDAPLFTMLWLSLYLPHWAAEIGADADPSPLAVTQGRGTRRRLIACNPAARAAGVQVPLDVPTALLRLPSLRLIERRLLEEQRALEALAAWAHQFTADVCLDLARSSLFLELGASLNYFHGIAPLQHRIRDALTPFHYTTVLAIAPTLEAAALLAAGSAPPPVVPSLTELRAVLSSIPLEQLPLEARTRTQLQAAGISILEDLLRIPADALARRFGPALPAYLRRLLGEDPDPRPRYRLPAVFRRTCDFLEPVETLEGLLFPLRRLLHELQAYLRARDVALQQLTLVCSPRESARPLTLHLTTSAPERDAATLFVLVRERLERLCLPSGVTRLELRAAEWVAPQILQQDLFSARALQARNWAGVLDKLRARLGSQAVRHLGLREDHRPEQAWCFAHPTDATAPAAAFPARPLWLLTPVPLKELPPLLGTPERIEGGWWHNEDTTRDYYLARSPEGARWWLYRDVRRGIWYLHGLWA